MSKPLKYSGKTKKGNSKVTLYTPTKGKSVKTVMIRKSNGKVMKIRTEITTTKGRY